MSADYKVCEIHFDASRMNARGECDECLDDKHETEILARKIGDFALWIGATK